MKFILLVLCSVFLMGCSPYVSEKEQNFPTKVSDSASLDSANDPLPLSSLFFDNIAYERMSGWKMVYSDEARASYLHPNFIEKEGPIHNALMVNVYHEQSPLDEMGLRLQDFQHQAFASKKRRMGVLPRVQHGCIRVVRCLSTS